MNSEPLTQQPEQPLQQATVSPQPIQPIKADMQPQNSNTLRTILVIVTLLLVNPLGLILMFIISGWKKWIKILILIILIPFYIFWIINLSNFIWRIKADRQASDANDYCGQQCAKIQDSITQCENDCLKSRLDPNIYQWYKSIINSK